MTASSSTVESKKRQYPCPGCGASLEYAPGATELACPYCGRRERIAQSPEQVEELSYVEYLRQVRVPVAKVAEKQVRCDACGATTATAQIARACPFCGSAQVVEVEVTEVIAPSAVLPFSIARAQATDRVRQWIASRWFAPGALRRLAAHEGIQGVYVPHWTYDAGTRTFYSGARGEHYWVTETVTRIVDGKPRTETRQVRHTRWWPKSGVVERFFDDVLVPAVKTMSTAELDALQPWDLEALVRYEPSFLAGFQALRYEQELEPGFERAKQIMQPKILADCRADIGGDEQRVDSTRTQYSAITFKQVLLPVWLAAYRFRNRSWRVRINARTGEIHGERPYSAAKIVALVLALAAIGLLVWLLAR